jgi:hypothetical protein
MLISGGSGAIVKIAYVDVFDTVGARGMPPSLLGPLATAWNSQYKFHDMALSSLVKRCDTLWRLMHSWCFMYPRNGKTWTSMG